jgi:hypothetical protein
MPLRALLSMAELTQRRARMERHPRSRNARRWRAPVARSKSGRHDPGRDLDRSRISRPPQVQPSRLFDRGRSDAARATFSCASSCLRSSSRSRLTDTIAAIGRPYLDTTMPSSWSRAFASSSGSNLRAVETSKIFISVARVRLARNLMGTGTTRQGICF